MVMVLVSIFLTFSVTAISAVRLRSQTIALMVLRAAMASMQLVFFRVASTLPLSMPQATGMELIPPLVWRLRLARMLTIHRGVAIAFFQPSTMDGTSSLPLDLASLGGEL
jgi:hypothetical protein